MRTSLLRVCVHCAPIEARSDLSALDVQKAAKLEKQKILEKKGIEKASKEFCAAIAYYEKHNSRWKSKREINNNLNALSEAEKVKE